MCLKKIIMTERGTALTENIEHGSNGKVPQNRNIIAIAIHTWEKVIDSVRKLCVHQWPLEWMGNFDFWEETEKVQYTKMYISPH